MTDRRRRSPRQQPRRPLYYRPHLVQLEARQLLSCAPPLTWCTDDTFTEPETDTAGHVFHDVNGPSNFSNNRAHAVALQTVGQEQRIVMAGYSVKPSTQARSMPPLISSEWAVTVLRNDGVGFDGQLHPAFNNGQAVTYQFGSLSDPPNGQIDTINAVAIEPNGDIIVVGQVWTTGQPLSQQIAGVMRIKGTGPDAGKPDLTFGGDCNDKTVEGICMTDDPGEVSIRWPNPGILHYARRNVATAVAIQSIDGFNKIVVGGWADFAGLPVMPGKWFAVTRLCPDGQLDNGVNCGPTGFGDTDPANPALRTGRTTFKLRQEDEVHALVAVDLKIVLVGRAAALRRISAGPGTPMPMTSDFAIARLCPDGKLDTGKPAPVGCSGAGFGADDPEGSGTARTGMRLVDMFGRTDSARDVVLQKVQIGFETHTRILVVGSSSLGMSQSDYALVRLDRNGDLDPSFGINGKRLLGPDSIDVAYGVALQPPSATNAEIVIAGYSRGSISATPYMSGARLSANGTGTPDILRSNFAGTPSGGSGDQARGVVIQSDGKIVAGGFHALSTGDVFGVVRFCSGPMPEQPCGLPPPIPYAPHRLEVAAAPSSPAERPAEYAMRDILAGPPTMPFMEIPPRSMRVSRTCRPRMLLASAQPEWVDRSNHQPGAQAMGTRHPGDCASG